MYGILDELELPHEGRRMDTADEPASLPEQDADELEVERLQQVVRDKRAALDAAKSGTPAYQPALAAVLLATVELVNHEARIPVRRRKIYSARTAQIVQRTGVVTAACVAAVALLTLTPWVSAWWLMLLVVLFLCGFAVMVTADAAAPSDLPTRRYAARTWTVAVGVDLVLVIVSRWLPLWLAASLVALATVICLYATWQLVADSAGQQSDTTIES